MDEVKLDEELARVAPLADPTRRRLYVIVASRPDGAGREEAAEVAGITRSLAAFHLDRLVEEGLLAIEYRRLTGRSGPGAGRPAKIYRRSGWQISLNLPPKNYELLARLMAQALVTGVGGSAGDALASAAHDLGADLGRQARRRAGARAGEERLLSEAAGVLDDCGFEAARDGVGLCLGNCPFSPLSQQFTEVVCRMNLSLMEGVAEGLHLRGSAPVLAPSPDRCCVVFQPRPAN